MKKIICSNIRKELSKLINIKGMNLEKYFKKELSNSKFNITYQELIEIFKEDNLLKLKRENNIDLILPTEEFYSTKEYSLNEDELYNWTYIKTLFVEELNMNILLVYKIIKDLGEVNYAEISNNLKKLMDIKLDIKQISHYCKEIKIMNLISSETNLNISNEKVVKIKNIEYENLNKKKLFKEENEYDLDFQEDNVYKYSKF